MYQQPTLQRIGAAHEVILGIISFGTDLDGHYLPVYDEMAEDPSFFDGASEPGAFDAL